MSDRDFVWIALTGSFALASLVATVKLEPWARERFMWWTVGVAWVAFLATAWTVLFR